jgi:hypothetical protein
VDLDLPKALAELMGTNPIFTCHPGDVLGDDADE